MSDDECLNSCTVKTKISGEYPMKSNRLAARPKGGAKLHQSINPKTKS